MAARRLLAQVAASGSLAKTLGFSKPQWGPSDVTGMLRKQLPFYISSQLCSGSGSGQVTSNISDAQYWIQQWDIGKTGFHKDYIHPLLKKHISLLSNGKSNIRIFFPLCGKAVDMKWLADMGHTVIGVEVSLKAVEDFFTEQNIPCTVQPISVIDGTLFQSEDGKLHLYCCDFFEFSKDIAGQLDAIWDRASIVAICKEDREKYVSVLKELMGPGCSYLLGALQYDETEYGGPPHNLSTESINTFFGGDFSIEEIDDIDGLEPRHIAMGIKSMREKLFYISRR